MISEDIALSVSDVVGISLPKAREVVRKVLSCMVEALQRNEKVEIRSFGSFRVKHYKPHNSHIRIGYTPSIWLIPSRNRVRFKPGRELKLLLNPPEDGQWPSPYQTHLPKS